MILFIEQNAIVLICSNLEGYVHGWSDLGGGEFHVGILAEEVHCYHFLTLAAKEARQTTAHGFPVHNQTLGSILTI